MFKKYKRKGSVDARPYIKGEKLPEEVSISKADRDAGAPREGDMIARNPKNHNDMWLIDGKYFADNYHTEPLPDPLLPYEHKQDGEGNWYWIPLDLVGEFERLSNGLNGVEYMENPEIFEEFITKFEGYSTGGDMTCIPENYKNINN